MGTRLFHPFLGCDDCAHKNLNRVLLLSEHGDVLGAKAPPLGHPPFARVTDYQSPFPQYRHPVHEVEPPPGLQETRLLRKRNLLPELPARQHDRRLGEKERTARVQEMIDLLKQAAPDSRSNRHFHYK